MLSEEQRMERELIDVTAKAQVLTGAVIVLVIIGASLGYGLYIESGRAETYERALEGAGADKKAAIAGTLKVCSETCTRMTDERDAELRDMFFGLEACIGLVEGGDHEWPEWETIEELPMGEFRKAVRQYANADWLASTIFLQYHDKYADKERMMAWLGKPVGQYAPPYTKASQ